jgi:hypothetical protein
MAGLLVVVGTACGTKACGVHKSRPLAFSGEIGGPSWILPGRNSLPVLRLEVFTELLGGDEPARIGWGVDPKTNPPLAPGNTGNRMAR